MHNSTPSATDVAFPIDRFVIGSSGVTTYVLRPYWQQHPELSPPLPGSSCVLIAIWRDGTMAGVPTGADAATLAKFYAAARMVAVLQSDGVCETREP